MYSRQMYVIRFNKHLIYMCNIPFDRQLHGYGLVKPPFFIGTPAIPGTPKFQGYWNRPENSEFGIPPKMDQLWPTKSQRIENLIENTKKGPKSPKLWSDIWTNVEFSKLQFSRRKVELKVVEKSRCRPLVKFRKWCPHPWKPLEVGGSDLIWVLERPWRWFLICNYQTKFIFLNDIGHSYVCFCDLQFLNETETPFRKRFETTDHLQFAEFLAPSGKSINYKQFVFQIKSNQELLDLVSYKTKQKK